MKNPKARARKTRLTPAQRYARLKAANDRMEARLKANHETPDAWLRRVVGESFKQVVRT